jgi:transposase
VRQRLSHHGPRRRLCQFLPRLQKDLNDSGMNKNHAIAGAVLDCGFHELRRQLQHEAAMRGGAAIAGRLTQRVEMS